MTIEHQDTTTDGGSNLLNNINAVEVAKVGDNVFGLVVGEDHVLQVYEIDNDPSSPSYGQMSNTPVDSFTDTGSTLFEKGLSLEAVEVDGTTVIFAGGDDRGITSFTLDDTGSLTQVQNFSDNGATHLDKTQTMTSLTVDDGAGGTNTFLFTGDEGAEGLSVFEVSSDGTFTNVDNFADNGTVGLKKVFGMDSVQVDDGAGGLNSFVIAAGKDDNIVSVFEVASDGTLTNTDNVDDSVAPYVKSAFEVSTHVIDDKAYVFVGGDEKGISAFEVGSDGSLTNVGNFADNSSLNIEKIRSIHIADHEGTPTMWVGGNDEGLDVFEISVNSGSGALSINRVQEYSRDSFSTQEVTSIAGDAGFVIAGSRGDNAVESFTAPCFAPGTLILTPEGERPVEDLAVGDLVVTADRGAQPIRWIGVREVVFGTPQVDTQKPIQTKAGALGGGRPFRDMVVSPQHRMVLEDRGAEVLALAKALTSLRGVRRMAGKRQVTYHALLFDQHEVIFAERAPTESFRPGPFIMSRFSREQRAEVLAAVPALRLGAAGLGPPARPILKRREAEALARQLARPDAAEFAEWDQDLAEERLVPQLDRSA